MHKCPCCHGERGFDVSAFEAPLSAIARAVGLALDFVGWLSCDVCDGTGEVTWEVARDYEAWAVARVDQVLAALDAGEVSVP
jgi:hypothetical protein